jgi:ribonucleoside-diphosphate reductase beta chain
VERMLGEKMIFYACIMEEELFSGETRYTLFPIKYPEIWQFYKDARASDWHAEELDLEQDIKDWERLTVNEKIFIENILAFFSGADGIVNENLAENFGRQVNIMEVKCFYDFQKVIENVHNEVYSLLIDTYVKDEERKARLFNAITEMPEITKLYKWIQNWIRIEPYNPDGTINVKNYARRLVAFACVEGILFSGPFCAIFWLKERGILKGLTFSNELISKDEGLHRDFACLLYGMLRNKLTYAEVLEIVSEAVDFEIAFTNESLKVDLIGMSRQKMGDYIKFVADHLLVSLGYKSHWNVACPFPFMEKISFNGKSNFFERRVSEYNKSGFEKGATDAPEIVEDF